jgi:hypothetical protein
MAKRLRAPPSIWGRLSSNSNCMDRINDVVNFGMLLKHKNFTI